MEEQKSRIESNIPDKLRNLRNKRQRILSEIQGELNNIDKFIQSLTELKNLDFNFCDLKWQDVLEEIIRNKSVSGEIVNALFTEAIPTEESTLALLKKSISHHTNLLDLNNYFVKSAVEHIVKSNIHGMEDISETVSFNRTHVPQTIIDAVHSTLNLMQKKNKSALHIDELQNNISYLEEVVKSLKLLSDLMISEEIERFYRRKDTILEDKRQAATQISDDQHNKPPLNTGSPAFSGSGSNF